MVLSQKAWLVTWLTSVFLCVESQEPMPLLASWTILGGETGAGGQLAVQLLTARPALIHWSPLLLSSLGADGECLLITAIVTRTPGVQRLLTASLKSPEKMLKKCFRGGGD